MNVEETGGLPDYIVRVAKHIWNGGTHGYTVSQAIAGSVSQVKKRAAKGNKQAVAAIAQWEKMKMEAKSTTDSSKTKKLSHSGTVSGGSMSSSSSGQKAKLLKAVKLYKAQKGKMTQIERARVKSAILGAMARQKEPSLKSGSVSQDRLNK